MDDYLVSVVKGGKVIELYLSEELHNIRAIRAIHRGCEVETMLVASTEEKKSSVWDDDSPQKKVRGNRVRCIETGVVYPSVKACSQQTGIVSGGIYESIRLHIAAKGLHFEYLKD